MALMKSITPDRCQQELQEVGGSDFGFAFGDLARFRVSIFKQRGNIAMVLRQIPNKLLTMEQLGLPAVCERLIQRPRGLFLVTGPTGSGKSTSLASMINYLNENVDHHIITIEDPIEFYHPNKKSTVNQREVGVDVPSFSEAIRRALRQDPDVILVGEMRDLETIEAAISAAETGHVVFGTLHTTGAQGTVNRIIDVFPTNQQDQIRTQLSTSIIGVLVASADAQDRRRPRRRVRDCWSCTLGHRQPDSRKQDLPHHLGHSDRRQARHDAARRRAVSASGKTASAPKEDVLAKANSPDELAARIANAERGMFDDETTPTRTMTKRRRRPGNEQRNTHLDSTSRQRRT